MNYIFLTPSIANIGGAEKYIYSKSVFLRKRGYKVIVAYYNMGDIILDYSGCTTLYYPELYFSPRVIGKRKTNSIISKISTYLLDSDTIIESSTLALGQWGEAMAKRYHCKHLLFSLQENFSVRNPSEIDFLKFKLERGELAGIEDSSVSKMFRGYENVIPSSGCRLIAASSYPVESIKADPHLLESCDHADYVIGSIGRTDKVLKDVLVCNVKEYARIHSDKRVLLLLIGGPKVSIETDVENLQIICTGYLFPIPLELIKRLHVNVATSGSSFVSMYEGIPTITTSAEDGRAFGILNITTSNALYPDQNDLVDSICHYLINLLDKKIFDFDKEIKHYQKPDHASINNRFLEHFSFLANSSKEKKYYDVFSICLSKKQLIQKFLLAFIPVSTVRRI